MTVSRYHPMQGSRKFATANLPVVKSFRVNFNTNSVTGVKTLAHFPKGTLVLGFQCKVNTAFTSPGSMTLEAGFSVSTSGAMTSSVIGKSTLVADYIFGPSTTYIKAPLLLTAGDNFDIDVGTTTVTTGQLDVHVLHIPPPDGKITDDDLFQSYDVT
jgi:hypothetical protein